VTARRPFDPVAITIARIRVAVENGRARQAIARANEHNRRATPQLERGSRLS
jgi:hypothetical protein